MSIWMDWGDEYPHNSFDLHCLLNSFPGDLEFKQIFSDIDEKIEQNAISIEHCIKEIQSEVNKQCPDVQLQTTTDCFEWLNNYNYNSSKSPSIPHGDLINFLKILRDLLKNEQNQEEMVLNLLWDLSCQSRVSFPSTVSGASFHFLSRTSLHSVEDHSSMDVKSLWDDIRLHLRRFLVSKLQSHNEINNSQQKILLKNQCIQQLLFLYPESEVTSKYQSIQNKLLTTLLQNCFPSFSRESNLGIMADRYQGTILKLYSMIKEDFNTLHEILAPSSTVKFIKETYLDTVTEEMAKFLEKFCELQFKESAVPVVKTSKNSSKHRGTVHALVTPEYPQKGRNFFLSLDELKFLSQLVKSFLKLEKNVQELFEEMFLWLRIPRNTSGILEASNREIVIEKPRTNETSITSEQLLPVTEFCSDIMEKLDIMLPLALACRDDFFQEIRANFVEACCKVATAVLARLQERSKEFPSRAPLKNLHALLSTAVYVFQHFMQYDRVMKENAKKLDVTTILICTENMLWSVCTSVQKLLNPHAYVDDKIFKIHTHCNNLFTTLVILTSPLTELHQAFQHGLGDSSSDSLKPIFKQPLHWLSCISHFYPSLLRTPSAGRLTAEGQLKLLLSQPGCNWNLLLETLLHHDGLLLRILLKSSKCIFQDQVSDTENNLNQGSNLIEAVFQVLYHCTFSPQTFGNVFVNYMEEEQLWDFLYNIPGYLTFFQYTDYFGESSTISSHQNLTYFGQVSTHRESEGEVIRCLRLALTDAVKDIVQQVVSVMSSGSSCERNLNKRSIPEHLRESIPKEWNYIPKETKRKESSKGFTRLAAQAVSIVISKLPTVIACLPPPIKYFFFLSERKMSENFVELKKAGLLVWNLIVIICRIFEDGNTVELLTGASLDRWSKEKLGLVCVCLESITGEQTSRPNQMTQKVIRSIEQQKPNWVECQLLKARKLSTECAFMTIEKSTALEEGDIALELTEQKINMMVLDICHKPGGSEYLRQIYHIMRLNEGYLKEQLFSMNGSEEKPLPIQSLKTTLRSVEDQPSAFNPFHVYKVFSKSMLDQSAITKWNWNWSNLLPNYLGLDKMTFSVLLKNRLSNEMVIAFARELTKRNTLYSFLRGESPDCHFDIVFFAAGTNLCRFFSLYLIYSKLIRKNCGVENNLGRQWNALLF
ncbi:hypothetical protein MJT46_007407 [Ovis ammon polii x Ovis aries]|nr:hypothetical protein MJT46_007407 [Ovis ammon polii x Ovis aries]